MFTRECTGVKDVLDDEWVTLDEMLVMVVFVFGWFL